MCLVIALVCYVMAYMFFQDGNHMAFIVNLVLGLFFSALMIRNIIKTHKNNQEDF